MKAFIGHSFDDRDENLVKKVIRFIESAGIECLTGEKAQNRSIAQKVKERILDCEIFIGIFTIDKPLCQENKRIWCNPRKKCKAYSTSNWVIQESGFAIGQKRELILLVEEGIDKFPELQGDMEIISFQRDQIEKKWLILNEMLENIKTNVTRGAVEKPPEETKSKEVKEIKKEESLDEKDVKIKEIYMALFRDKDYKKAQRILSEELKIKLNPREVSEWEAWVLRQSHPLGDKNAFVKLEKLVEQNSENPNVIIELAWRYKEIREFKKAKDLFIHTAEKYDANDHKNRDTIVNCYIEASRCLASDNDYDNAFAQLKGLLSNPTFEQQKASIFEAMARIYKDKGDVGSFLFYSEAALAIDPNNTQLRFELAYAYSQNKYEQLSLLHYKRLTDTTLDKVALNNLGVQYNELEMAGKCVESYCKSAELKETLAMANLAGKYLNEGFITDAMNLISKANKFSTEGIQPDYRVGNAQKRLMDIVEKETKKEAEELREAENQRKFWVGFTNALCSNQKVNKNQIDGDWQTSRGNMQLVFNEASSTFEAVIQIKEIERDYLASILSGREPKKDIKTIPLNIKGSINNMTGRYSILSRSASGTTLLTGYMPNEATGYMIINETCNCIEILEKDKDGKITLEQWKKNK